VDDGQFGAKISCQIQLGFSINPITLFAHPFKLSLRPCIGLVTEEHEERLSIEEPVRLAADLSPLEIMGRVEDRLDLIAGEVKPGDEIPSLKCGVCRAYPSSVFSI